MHESAKDLPCGWRQIPQMLMNSHPIVQLYQAHRAVPRFMVLLSYVWAPIPVFQVLGHL